MRVTRQGGVVHLEVADDGTGFDPARRSGGFGLPGMRERVGLLGASSRSPPRPVARIAADQRPSPSRLRRVGLALAVHVRRQERELVTAVESRVPAAELEELLA